MKAFVYSLLIRVVPALFFKMQHYRIHQKYGSHTYWADLDHPKTFNEVVLSRKLLPEKDALGLLVDKVRVKEFVRDAIGEEYVIPTHQSLYLGDELDLDMLQFPCIMKPTHLSGFAKIYQHRDEFDRTEFLQLRSRYDAMSLYKITGERQYKSLKPGIIFEELLSEPGGSLKDYKFFCFDGEPRFVQVDVDRFTNHTRAFYDMNWTKQPFSTMYPVYTDPLEPPATFQRMIELARSLSSDFSFVRVDLYEALGKVYFGELTFDHGGGYEPFTTYDDDLLFGTYYREALRNRGSK